jgi:2-polyprenyl-6-methoxyphenol hydroxylase-like FAD-dependent oxidoreductase
LIACHAVIVGAGIGGLAAAKAVAPFFGKVVVLDRDDLPEAPTPRAGAPQSGHAHYFLAGGQRALGELFPGIEADLQAAGALKSRIALDVLFERPGYDPFPQRDLGLEAFSLSRPLLENVCRRRLQREANIEIRSRVRVTALAPNAEGDGIAGVHCERDGAGEEAIPADLVIDASGRAIPTLKLLERLGWPSPPVTEIGVDLAYATAVFELPDDKRRDWIGVAHFSGPSHKSRAGLILEVERRRWIASLIGMHGDAPPDDIAGFLAFAKSFRTPSFYNALRSARHVGQIARFNLRASVRRHFERLDRFPRGLIPLGDSVCRFNPVFGQGMSVAIQEAAFLARLLTSHRSLADPLDGSSAQYLSGIQAVLEAPWATATLDLAHPKTQGERPADIQERAKYAKALQSLAAEDPDVHRVMAEVNHLIRPYTALRDPILAERVLQRSKELA